MPLLVSRLHAATAFRLHDGCTALKHLAMSVHPASASVVLVTCHDTHEIHTTGALWHSVQS